jgi:hypothetical protein
MSLRTFISYKWESPEHVAWVKTLSTDLRTNGIDAILDQWEVRLGDSLSTYMATMIGKADVIIFVVTPGFVSSAEAGQHEGGSVQFEVQLSLARRLHGDATRLIPIYRSGDAIPLQFRDSLYCDFRRDSDYSTALARLVTDLVGRTDKPALSETSDPSVELTRRIQACWMVVAQLGQASMRYGAAAKQNQQALRGDLLTLKKQFGDYTTELANFSSSRAHLFPLHIRNIYCLIWADFMDFEPMMDGLILEDVHYLCADLIDWAGIKIDFLQAALTALTAGRPAPIPPRIEDAPKLYRSRLNTVSLPDYGLDLTVLNRIDAGETL